MALKLANALDAEEGIERYGGIFPEWQKLGQESTRYEVTSFLKAGLC